MAARGRGGPDGSYVEWMRICTRITLTAHPVISLPAGFTDGGLPVGLQLVGRHRGEAALLRLAAAVHPGWREPASSSRSPSSSR